MERGGPLVPHAWDARVEIWSMCTAEAKRDPSLALPPDWCWHDRGGKPLRYAGVSAAGAVGLMQVMRFGRANGGRIKLVRVAPKHPDGGARVPLLLRAENPQLARALARYNGASGANTTRRW